MLIGPSKNIANNGKGMYVGLKQPLGDGERCMTPARAAAKGTNVKAVHEIFCFEIIRCRNFFSLYSELEQASHVNFQNREYSTFQWFLRL